MLDQVMQILLTNKYTFVDNFKSTIKEYIQSLFPQLHYDDINILHELTSYLIEDISTKYNLSNSDPNAYLQWTQNNGRDIISLCLTLLPFINSTPDNDNYSKITKLSDIIYKGNGNIPINLLEVDIKQTLKQHFPYSTFALGLLNNKDNQLCNLYPDINHIIYKIIHYNFLSILETIKITNGKLYINWINTVPVFDYKNTNFYKTSMNEIANVSSLTQDNIQSLLINNKGLWIGDYYNVMRNGYYDSIRTIKWTIYCRNINNKYYYSIQYLSKMININNILIYEDYDSMDDMSRVEFDESINKIASNLKNNTETYIDLNFELDLLKNLFIFMINNFSDTNILDYDIRKPFMLDLDNGTKPDTDIDDTQKILTTALIGALNGIEPKYIWAYIKETLIKLKTTPYGMYLIKNNTINTDFFNLPTTYKINLKNIYNIAKLFSHNPAPDNFIRQSKNFRGLDISSTYSFIALFFDTAFPWRLKRNIRLQEGTSANYNEIMSNIINGWNEIKIDLVWEYLHFNGLLSEFRINLEPNNRNKLNQYFTNNKKIFDANYFMTNEPYNNLEIDKLKYWDILIDSTKSEYITFYANNWLSQLNFFNHYINHSIMYVTGSTGTGKSTQVPKLTLYALKMYDYNNSGKVICTQPRIEPTRGNTIRIANEMGLPIISKEYKSELYYLQYKYKGARHTKDKCSHLTLQMVTDGTLLASLTSNPFLKTKYNFKIMDNNEYNSEYYKYSLNNVYDVVIIDEAHEHNTNMDLILTLMRQTCMYNNSVRLMIVSATMDDDESTYRSYFKLINDNIVFPIKQSSYHPVLKEPTFIDSIYLDRRFNISIPRESGLYRITEHYNPIPLTQDDRTNYKAAEEASYNVILNICTKYSIGDILLFSIGEEEIKQAVTRLNSILPSSVIALPFYSNMNIKYRNLVADIANKIGLIRNKRNMVAEEWNDIYIESTDVPLYTYKRAVIVATNVAEASITIPTLKFVVDIGYAKVNRYDPLLDTSSISIEQISEASRVQRKGRVGRVSDGHVFYMYGKGEREKVIPKYGITLADFHTSFLKLASTNTTGKYLLLLDTQLNPYLPKQFSENIDKLVEKEETKASRYNIIQILIEQFMIILDDTKIPIPESYFYSFNEYNGIIQPYQYLRVDDGYQSSQLFDKNGLFYIVHPLETKITRNLMGDIIEYDKKISDKIKIDHFKPLINILETKLLYLDINGGDEPKYKKTIYARKIYEMQELTSLDEKDSTILLLGCGYNIMLETFQVLSMIKAINGRVLTLIRKSGKYLMINEMKKIFSSDSDITSIYRICKLLKDYCKLEIYTIANTVNNYKSLYNEMVNHYRKRYYSILEKNGTINLFRWLYHNGKLDKDIGFLYWLKESGIFKKKLMDNILVNKHLIESVCESHYLDSNIIMEYYNILVDLIIDYLVANKDIDKKYNKESVFDWVTKIKPSLNKKILPSIEYKLNLIFIIAQPFISVKEIDYVNLRTGSQLSVLQVFNNEATLCNSLGSYLYYYSISNNIMNIVMNIDLSILPIYYPIYYNPRNIKNIIPLKQENGMTKLRQFNGPIWDRLVEIVSNKYSFNQFPLNTPELPIIQEYIASM